MTRGEELYEIERKTGVLRRDARLWVLTDRPTRDKWETFAKGLGRQVTLEAASALYEAALDQPRPTDVLRRAISWVGAERDG